MGSIGAGFLRANSQTKAVDRQKRADEINARRITDAWKASDLFLPAFGGGATGLLTDIGGDFRDIYSGIKAITPSVGESFAKYSSAAADLKPSLDQSEAIGKSILSGEAGQQLQDLRKPVYDARNKAVATSKQGMQEAIAESLNRMEATQRGRGFSGSSTAGDKAGASISRDIASQVAGQQGAADIANAEDASRVAIAARDEKNRAALGGLANQMLSGRFSFENAPLMAAVAQALAPQASFTAAAAPYMRDNKPPVMMKKAYPTDSMIWQGAIADSMDSIADIAMSYGSSMGGGQGGGGTPSGGGGGGMSGMQGLEGAGAGGGNMRTGGYSSIMSDSFA